MTRSTGSTGVDGTAELGTTGIAGVGTAGAAGVATEEMADCVMGLARAVLARLATARTERTVLVKNMVEKLGWVGLLSKD